MQSPEHGSTPVPIDFLIHFVRAMIRLRPSEDVFALAMMNANKEVPLTDEQRELFEKAVKHEADQSIWPKGFF